MIDDAALADAELRGAFAAQKEARRTAEQFLGIFDEHLPLGVLVERLCTQAQQERASRQDWAAEALRLDQLRKALAVAAKLPADVPDEVLLAEIAHRFQDTVRAVVGHAFVVGSPKCECGALLPTRLDWFDHTEALRAAGVPTATINPEGVPR